MSLHLVTSQPFAQIQYLPHAHPTQQPRSNGNKHNNFKDIQATDLKNLSDRRVRLNHTVWGWLDLSLINDYFLFLLMPRSSNIISSYSLGILHLDFLLMTVIVPWFAMILLWNSCKSSLHSVLLSMIIPFNSPFHCSPSKYWYLGMSTYHDGNCHGNRWLIKQVFAIFSVPIIKGKQNADACQIKQYPVRRNWQDGAKKRERNDLNMATKMFQGHTHSPGLICCMITMSSALIWAFTLLLEIWSYQT